MKTMTCEECATTFHRPKAQRWCSMRCAAIARHRRLDEERGRHTPMTCASCGVTVTMPTSVARVTKYCSRACYYKGRRQSPLEFTCLQCGKVSPVNVQRTQPQQYCSMRCRAESRRKGGSVSSQGYRVQSVNGKPILEHRQVMEGILGRPLLPTESIHHRGGDRLNNDPPNLELWDKSQPFGQRVSEKIEWAIAFLTRHGYHVSAPHSA